jgi:hypothetical protein
MEDIIFPLHIGSLVFAVTGILLADHSAFNWISGRNPTLDRAKLLKYHYWVLSGLSLMIITGLTLFWPERDYLLQNPAFYVKMFFVVSIILNSFFIGKLMNTAVVKTYAELGFRERLPLMVSGAVSAVGWLGAFVSAFFLEL